MPKDRSGSGRGRFGIASVILACFLSVSVGVPSAMAQATTKTKVQAKSAQKKPVVSRAADKKKITVTRQKTVQKKGAAKPARSAASKASQKKTTTARAPARTKVAVVPPSKTYQSVLTQTAADSGVRLGLPQLESQAVFVTDVETGMPLLAKNGNERRPIASITKIMTAMVVLDGKQDLNEKIRIDDSDVDRVKYSSSRLAVGTVLSRKELLNLALMSSENRAAHALGRAYQGGLPAFVKAMNAKASSLGLTQARFVDPTGLDPRNQASPRDLAHMVSAANDYKLIREFSTANEEQVRTRQRAQMFRNTNALVRNDNWDINVSKTGYIREAGRCLVMHASVNNRPTLIVLLNSGNTQSRIRDSIAIKRWLEDKETQSTLKAADILLGKATPDNDSLS